MEQNRTHVRPQGAPRPDLEELRAELRRLEKARQGNRAQRRAQARQGRRKGR